MNFLWIWIRFLELVHTSTFVVMKNGALALVLTSLKDTQSLKKHVVLNCGREEKFSETFFQ